MHYKSFYAAISLALALLFSLSGCKKENPDTPAPKLSLSSESVDIVPEGGVSFIEYAIVNPVEGKTVFAVAGSEWVYEFDYHEPGRISFKVDANPDFDQRATNVTVTYADAHPCVFKVVQSGVARPELELKSRTVEADPQGGDLYIEYELINPVPDAVLNAVAHDDWVSDFSFDTPGRIAFKVAENTQMEARETVVEISYPEVTPLSVKVLQSAGKLNILPITINGVTFNMILVEEGSFEMGATPEQGTEERDDVSDSEKPVHKVNISEFYMGEHEVTQELWFAVMGENPSSHQGVANLPVENVNWDDIQSFIAKLNGLSGMTFMLPSEAQWEYAARGGNKSKGYKFSGSNNINEVGWFADNSNGESHPVGQKKANELGIYDMCGNVYEWCNDWWYLYAEEEQTDPVGPENPDNGEFRAIRGGSYFYSPKRCRNARRRGYDPTYRIEDFGCRLILKLH